MNKIRVLRFANHCVVFLHIFYNILQKFDCNYYMVIKNDDVLVYLFSLRVIFKASALHRLLFFKAVNF